MQNRSLTLKLDADLFRKLEIVATKRGISVSALALASLVELVDDARDYHQTKDRAVALLRQGFDLGPVQARARTCRRERSYCQARVIHPSGYHRRTAAPVPVAHVHFQVRGH